MIFEHMFLVGDSNKFLLKKSVTETHCNRLQEIEQVGNRGDGDKKGC